jgi:hypothetical protein
MGKYFKVTIDKLADANSYAVRTGSNRGHIVFDKSSINKSLSYIRNRGGMFDLESYDRECRSLGFSIFSAFFIDAVNEEYREYTQNNQFPQVKLVIPEDLHSVPWELLRPSLEGEDETTYISRRGMIIRYVNHPDALRRVRDLTAPTTPPLRLLYVYASPATGFDAVLKPIFEIQNKLIQKFPRPYAKTYVDFKNNIGKNAKGLLFHGHARTEPSGEGVLVFENGNRAEEIPARFIGISTSTFETELVVLSACDTAFFSQDSFRQSVVGQIVCDGYPAIVTAYQNKIDQSAAVAFLDRFVGYLVQHSLLRCMREGRAAIRELYNPFQSMNSAIKLRVQRASRDWWLPVVYASTENPEIFEPHPVFDPSMGKFGSQRAAAAW